MLDRARRTPTSAIHKVANVDLVQVFLDKLNANFVNKCRFNVNEDIKLLIDESTV